MSKSDFKKAVGALYKDKLIIPEKLNTILVKEEVDNFMKQNEKKQLNNENKTNQNINYNNEAKLINTKNNDIINNQDTSKHVSKNTIFVGNLPPKTTEKDFSNYLDTIFDGMSQIKRIRLQMNTDGTCLGYGYIDIENILFVTEALNLIKMSPYHGRKLRTDIAEQKRIH